MHRLSRDGVTLCYEEAGQGGPPLLFVHGAFCDHSHFQPQFERFRTTHRVVSVDLRGHGESDKPVQDYTIAGFADDLAWLCGELGLYQPAIIGHSMGGMIALDLAARYPTLPSAIVALDSTIVPPPGTDVFLQPFTDGMHTPEYRDAVRHFMSMNFLPTDDAKRKSAILDAMTALPQHVISSVWDDHLRWDSTAAAAACKAPVVYVDHGAPNCDLNKFRELCPQLVIGQTVGSGHFATLEVPDQVNAMIERFLFVVAQQPAPVTAS
jgi:pimeloyl-ACP methyl ester carboxylesterase